MKAAAPTDFRELVRQAVAVRVALSQADTPRGNKLSRAAFKAAALTLAGIGEGAAKGLRDRLAAPGAFPETWPVLAATAGRWAEPGTWDPHPLALPVAARVELQGHAIQARELVAVTALLALERPGAFFGEASVAGEGAAKAEALRQELAELHRKIEAAVTSDMLDIVPHPNPTEAAAGWCRVLIAGTPVPASPGFGERLAAWCERQGHAGLPEPAPAAAAA